MYSDTNYYDVITQMTDYYDVTTLSYADVVQYNTELMKKIVFIKMLYIFLCNIFYFALQYYFDLIRKKSKQIINI